MRHLRQVVYASSSARALRDVEILSILDVSRQHNSAMHVTGMLLYGDGSFVQALEGEPPAVEKLLRKIKRDPRHRGFLILLDHVVPRRDFEGWSMGFQQVSHRELDAIAGFHNWTAEMPSRRKMEAAIRLIESFHRTVGKY